MSGLAQTGEECLRLTSDSLEKVQRWGLQEDPSGAVRGYVRSQDGKFRGNLKMEKVNFGPEKAMALQSAAVTMALKTAIADVQAAVEAVQETVDDIARLVRADAVGKVVGTYAHLEEVAESTQAHGRLLSADWDSVQGAGLELRQSLHSLRSYVTETLNSMDATDSYGERKKKLASVDKNDGIAGALRLILVAQKGLFLSEYLRVERVLTAEPESLQRAVSDAEDRLLSNREADRQLIALMAAKLEDLGVVRPLEVHLLSVKGLAKARNGAQIALGEFAHAVEHELPDLNRNVRRPKLVETRAEVKRIGGDVKDDAVRVSKSAGRVVKKGAGQVGTRGGEAGRQVARKVTRRE